MASTASPPSRRERKKAATRRALSEAAFRLFVERGFENVTVRQIADVVDVSTTTLMKHFPTKEALVFDLDDKIERALVSAVAERASETSAVEALRRYARARVARVTADERASEFMKLVLSTPSLGAYWRQMWMRHESALAGALAEASNRPRGDLWCATTAHFVLEAIALSERSSDAARTVEVAFDILEQGWGRSMSKPSRRSRVTST